MHHEARYSCVTDDGTRTSAELFVKSKFSHALLLGGCSSGLNYIEKNDSAAQVHVWLKRLLYGW